MVARRVIMPVTMEEEETKKLGILPSERFRYFNNPRAAEGTGMRALAPIYLVAGAQPQLE